MEKIKEYAKLVRKLMGLIRPLRVIMLLAIIFGSVGHIIATGIPVLGGYGLIQYAKGQLTLKYLIIVLVIFSFFRALLRYLEQLCNHYVAFRVLEIIRDKIFKRLRKLAPAKMDKMDTGKLVSIITADIELLEVFYAHTISPVSIAIIHTLFLTFVLGRINMLYSIVLLTFHLIMAIFLPLINSSRGKDIGDIQQEDVSNLNSSIMDTFYGIEESIQYFHGKNRREEMIGYTEKLNESSSRLSRIQGRNQGLSSATIMLGNICMLLVAAYLYRIGEVNTLGLIVPIILFMSSFGPVSALSNVSNNLLTTFACGERIMDLLQEKPEVEKNLAGEKIRMEELGVSNISFSYEEEEVFKDFNLSLKKGEILGISGKSGCGKSTLLKLIMRFYDVEKGAIEKNGIDIKNLNTEDLRKDQSYITQSSHLFDTSIWENLKIAKKEASREEIENACKKASIHEFIQNLPKGYETKVGDITNSLSTGEKQRVAIARGFLQEGSLLLLDEPTSNIDSLNESIILKSIWEEERDKGVVIVSHKESTLRIANRVENLKRTRKS